MTSGPEWLDIDIVLDFHAEQLALFGGADGIRDLGLLESALARPLNKFSYGETSLAALAASYGFGIAKNHPFIDGNKRTALASMIVFLGLNGLDLDAPQEAATAIILSLAAGECTEEVLSNWLADHIVPLEAPGIAP
jgi:death-on-curing protein